MEELKENRYREALDNAETGYKIMRSVARAFQDEPKEEDIERLVAEMLQNKTEQELRQIAQDVLVESLKHIYK